MRKINSQVMRYFNIMQVVRTVQKYGPISRTALTERVGLTTASVTNLTNELLEAGILRQVGHENTGTLGRKAAVLEINRSAFYVLGMEMNNCRIVIGLADFSGEIIESRQQAFDTASSVDATIDLIEELVHQILESAQIDARRLLGMGLALPGPLNSKAGVFRNPPNMPEWENVPICSILERRLGFPVCCDRETNAAALAESLYGVSAGCDTSFMLSLFTVGIGGGYVFDGRVVHGFHDGAGEIGHTTVAAGGKPCVCGNYGCLEALVSAGAIVERVQYLWKIGNAPQAMEHGEQLDLETVFLLSDQGEPVCRHVLEESASYIGIALRNVINTISPQMIVLVGPVVTMSSSFVEMIRAYLRKTPYPPHGSDIPVCPSAFGEMAFVKGGVILAMDAFLQSAVKAHLNRLPAEKNPLVI